MTRARAAANGDLARRRWQRFAPACVAGTLLVAGCGGDGGRKGDSTVRFELTTAQAVMGLASVQLSAESVARTFALQTLSPTPTRFDLVVPAQLLGTIQVNALARPASGCMGYAGMDLAYIGAVGDTAVVTIVMQPRDICQQPDGGTAGTGGGTAGAGGATGGSAGGAMAGTGGVAGVVGTGGSTGGSAGGATAGTGGVAGTGGAVGRGGSGGGAAGTGGGAAGTGGAAGRGGAGGGAAGTGGGAGRGGGGGAAGTGGGGAAGTGGGAAGTGGGAGRGGGGGAAGTGGGAGGGPGCTGTPGSLPSLTCCREFEHLAVAQTCDLNDTFLYAVAFSPDGTKMLTGGDDQRVKVWNFDGRTPTASGTVLPAVGYGFFAISPNGMNVAVGNDGGIDIYSTSNWALQRTLATSGEYNYGVGFAPDSARVISVDYYDEMFIHAITNPTALSTEVATVFGNGLVVAPTQLASGLGVVVPGLGGDVTAFSVTGTSTFGTELYFVPSSPGADMTAAFSPSGALLAVGDTDSNVRFWNYPLATAVTPPTGATISIGSTSGAPDAVGGVAFSPDGQHIAIAGGTGQGSVSIWNVSTRSMVSRFDMPAGHFGKSVAFSPSGSALVVGEWGCGKITVCSY
jgi:hypothetical protein